MFIQTRSETEDQSRMPAFLVAHPVFILDPHGRDSAQPGRLEVVDLHRPAHISQRLLAQRARTPGAALQDLR